MRPVLQRYRRAILLGGALAFAGSPASADIRANDAIRVSTVTDGTSTTLHYRVDGKKSEYTTALDGAKFVTPGSVSIALRNFNPLRQSIVISISDAKDDRYEVLTKLIGSLSDTFVALGIKPAKDDLRPLMAQGDTCLAEKREAETAVSTLDARLNDDIWKAPRFAQVIERAATKIDTAHNESGFAEAVAEVTNFIDGSGTPPAAGAAPTSLKAALAQLEEAIAAVEKPLSVKEPSSCLEQVMPLYRLAHLTDPSRRLSSYRKLSAGLSKIAADLGTYHDWSTVHGDEYVLKRITPTSDTLKKVEIKAQKISYEIGDDAITTKAAALASATFEVRHYTVWVPEIGVGMTYSRYELKTYGTGQGTDGKTVLAETKRTQTNFDPTLMVNFVCGFCGASLLTPMLQIGTSTSTTTPGLFAGAGFKVIGGSKGALAIGAGFAVPFSKQPKNQEDVGKAIDGTAALADKLEFRPVRGQHWYLNLQYKFN